MEMDKTTIKDEIAYFANYAITVVRIRNDRF